MIGLSKNFGVKKGITPVLSIVLLVLIMVGLIGGAYLFISGSQEEAQAQVKEAQSRTSESVASKIVIETVWNNSGNIGVQIRNIGGTEYTAEEISQINAYVDDVPATISGLSGSLAVGATTTFDINTPYSEGAVIKLTFPKGGSDTKIAP